MNLTIVIVEKGRRGRPHSETAPGSVRLLLVVTRLISLSLALTLVPALQAEAHCPGSAVSLRFPSSPRFQIIVPVGINHTGPSAFLVDTGTQLTIVDPSLATELQLETQSTAAVGGIGFNANTFLARVESLQVGSRSIENHVVELQRTELLQATGFHTGDLASCDADGLHWFVGRRKEIIVRRGSNISRQEVEAVQHPAELALLFVQSARRTPILISADPGRGQITSCLAPFPASSQPQFQSDFRLICPMRRFPPMRIKLGAIFLVCVIMAFLSACHSAPPAQTPILISLSVPGAVPPDFINLLPPTSGSFSILPLSWSLLPGKFAIAASTILRNKVGRRLRFETTKKTPARGECLS